MMGDLPESTARSIGATILHTAEALAVLSVLCTMAAGICLLLAGRSTGGRAAVFRWLAVLLAVAALVPPVFVAWTVGR